MTGYTTELIEVLLLEVRELNRHGKHRDTEALLKPFIESSESLQFPSLRTRALIMYSSVVTLNGRATQALAFANEAIKLCSSLPSEDSKELLPKALGCAGSCHSYLSNFDTALALFQESLSLCKEHNFNHEMERCLGDIATVYRDIGDYSRSLEYYQQALDVAKELGNAIGITSWMNGIGIIHKNLGAYDRALEYFQYALAIEVNGGVATRIATMLGNIGTVYNDLGDPTTALEYTQRALAIDEESGNRLGVARHHGNIGQLYIELNEPATAMEYLQRALALDSELENKWNVCVWTGLIGSVYANKDYLQYDAALAEEFFFRTLDLSGVANNKTMLLEAHRALSDLYKEQERWKEHAEEFQKFYTIEKEIHSEEVLNKTRMLENRRRVEEAERDRQVKLARLQEHEKLLMRVLPPSIAQRMVGGEELIADYFENVTILFSDIKGFTTITAHMPAYTMVQFLGAVFSEFDRIMQKYGCEKIKTIGDGYMAVSGAPMKCEDHAERMVHAAFEMLESIKIPDGLEEYFPDGTHLGVRIGIHTGAVVAGVVGADKFVYDVYSDAVNTASRMESHGEVDRIHVSSDFVLHLQNRYAMTNNTTHGINFLQRGEMEIKGKGLMQTFFLEKA